MNLAIPGIERATGLTFKRAPVAQPRTQAQFHTFMAESFERELSPGELAGEQSLYRLLGLLPDTLDLKKVLLDFYTEQAIGLYDPAKKVLFIRSDAKPDQIEFTLQHELVHALQDQYMNLDSIEHTKGDGDRQLAAQAVIEGQAMVVPLQVMAGPGVDIGARIPGGWEAIRQQIRERSEEMPEIARAPLVVREAALFPYLSGADFIRRFQMKRPGQVPYNAGMPHSTEQVLHTEAYFDATRDEPTRIVLPPPKGATERYQDDLGEFGIRVLLFQHLEDQNVAVRTAAGWDGDRYQVLSTQSGDGLAWLTIWDSPVDAAEFRDAMQSVIAKRFNAPTAQPASSGAQRFATGTRALLLWAGDVSGRPAVLYVDVPAGVRTDVMDLASVKLEK